MSDDKQTIWEAIYAVQAEAKIVKKDATGHNHKYASYPQLAGLLRPLMRKNGLVITHRPTHLTTDSLIIHAMHTVLFHVPSGEFVEEVWPVVVPQVKSVNEAQALGMGQTYGKRYFEVSLFALPVGDDADEKRFNAGDKEPKPAAPPANLMGKTECLRAIEKAADFAAVTRITKAHKEISVTDGWDAELANLFHQRKDEFEA